MIRDDLGYQNLPVTVVGIGGGVIYSTLGATHYAKEDIAIAGSIPNMTILAPTDPDESREITRWVVKREIGGPVYLRFGKAGEPNLTKGAAEPFVFGKLRRLTIGDDVAVNFKPRSVSFVSPAYTLAELFDAPVTVTLPVQRGAFVIPDAITEHAGTVLF